jgi:hypothetical protein
MLALDHRLVAAEREAMQQTSHALESAPKPRDDVYERVFSRLYDLPGEMRIRNG